MKKKICIIIAIVLFLAVGIYALKQKQQLGLYEHGFDITGTYEYIDKTSSAENKEDYLVFQEDVKSVYSYKQFGQRTDGKFAKTDTPNLYVLEGLSNDKGSKWFVLLEKDGLSLINRDNTIIKYNKIADEGVFINVDGPDN